MNESVSDIIWDKIAPEKDRPKLEALLTAFATDGLLQGEMFGLRLRDGVGGGCLLEGPMLGCEFQRDGENAIADVRYAGKWRVW